MKFLSVCLLLTLLSEVYVKESESGTLSFSSKPSSGAQKADLPEITKVDIEENVKKLKKKTPLTCTTKGGIDCEAGSDADGSVICYDGFKGSIERWNFKCGFAKLEVLEVNEKGFVLKNNGPAEAQSLRFRTNCSKKPKITRSLAAYGLANYTFSEFCANNTQDIKLSVTCKNCNGINSINAGQN